jgi:beta-lactam-binding protein with PASTA domain
VMHSLAKGRDERYQTAAEFRADVEAARGGRQVNVAVPALTGSQATTQYVPPVDGTGTRLAPVGVGGGLLGNDPSATGTMGQPYDPYATNEYGGRRDQRPPERSNRNAILAGLAALVVIIVVGFLVLHSLGNKSDQASNSISVPDVQGQASAEAVKNLETAGFAAANIKTTSASSTDDQKGKVVSQNPTASQSVDKTTIITLTIGSGPASITVPNVAGKSVTDATEALEQAGLTVASTTKSVVDSSVSAGQVSKTDPAAGDSASKGDTITLYVAADTVTIPDDLINSTYTKAAAELRSLGLHVAEKKVTDESPAGTVLQSSPEAGEQVKKGSTVTLTVAKAPVVSTPTDTPTPTPTMTPTSTPTPTETAPPAQ